MSRDGVYNQFYMIIKDVEEAIKGLEDDLVDAFRKGDHEEVERLNRTALDLRAYIEEIRQIQTKWVHNFEERVRLRAKYNPKPDISDPPIPERLNSDYIREPKTPITPHEKDDRTKLRVELASGKVIERQFAAQTLVAVVREFGLEQVRSLGLKVNNHLFISTEEHNRYQQQRVGQYWIMTHSSTKHKKDLLEEIARRLNKTIKIQIIM